MPFAVQGGRPPFTWVSQYSPPGPGQTAGLPPRVTLSTAGILSGTPTASGNYAFSVRVNDGSGNSASLPVTVPMLNSGDTVTPTGLISQGVTMTATKPGIFRFNVNPVTTAFLEDSNGSGAYDAGVDRYLPGFTGPGGFIPGDVPVADYWTGDGHAKVGIYRPSTGKWYLDANDNGVYDGADLTYSFGGLPGDMPFVGNWNNAGKSCIGLYRSVGSVWLLDLNCNGVFENTPTDAFFPFGGLAGDVPVVGAWTGGSTRVGVVRKYAPGGVPQGEPFLWVMDAGAANAGNTPADHPAAANAFAFGGLAGDVFVSGDWTGMGITTAGVYRAGFWVLDAALPGAPQAQHVPGLTSWYGGVAGDVPVPAKWAALAVTCQNSTTELYFNNFYVRQADNTIYAYAVSGPASGDYAAMWQPFVSTWLYKDGNLLDSHQRDSTPAGLNHYIARSYTTTLQSEGPGQYHLKSYHEWYAAACNHWVPPYLSGWNGYSDSYKTVTRPTITMGVLPYRLGGPASSNDYSAQTTMSVVNKNEATSTPTWSFYGGSTFGNLSCTTCNTSTLTVTRAPTKCGAYDIVMQANFGGFYSDPYWIDIQTPDLLSFVRIDVPLLQPDGWESDIVYKIFNGCQQQMTNVTVNEVFTAWQRFNGSNWTAPLAADGWASMVWDPKTNGWTFVDYLWERRGDGYMPAPFDIGTNNFDESPASLMTQHTQKLRVGSAFNGSPTASPVIQAGQHKGTMELPKVCWCRQIAISIIWTTETMEGINNAMYRNIRTPILALVITGMTVTQSPAGTPLQSLVGASSAMVIARIDNAFFDGTLYHVQLRVVLSLKGTLLPGTTVEPDFAHPGPGKLRIAPGVPQGSVLVAMTQDGQGSWHLTPLGAPALGLAAAYFRISDQALAGAASMNGTPEANIAKLMGASVEADSAPDSRFLGLVGYSDAPALFDSWSASSSPRLRAYGLSKRILVQDAAAVASVGAALGATARKDAVWLTSALGAYRNPDPNGVRAIGKLATTPGADPQLIVSCAYALSAIHTKESVPYLASLLDSTDHEVRAVAVGGISSFVTNMRIAKDGVDSAEARDEVLNPGRRRKLPSSEAPFETTTTRPFLHFGSFKDAADEAYVITFWKSWYQQNRGQF